MAKILTFETDIYSLIAQVQERFNAIRMFTPELERETGVNIKNVMSGANRLIRGVGMVSSHDNRTRMKVSFARVMEHKTANPTKIFQELISCRTSDEKKKSAPLSLLHYVLRLHADVNNANGLGDILPREMKNCFVSPHHTTAGWVMLRCINAGNRRYPAWFIDVDPLDHAAYDYKQGTVIMTVVP